MENMFCYQCEQTAQGTGCTVSGVCGKNPEVAYEQDALTCEMIALAKVMVLTGEHGSEYVDAICDGLFATITNVNFDGAKIAKMAGELKAKRESVVAKGALSPDSSGLKGIMDKLFKIFAKEDSETEKFKGTVPISARELFHGDDKNSLSLRSTLLFGLRGMAAYAHHARVLGKRNPEVDAWLVKGMAALADEHSVDEWLSLLMEFGGINLKCMALLDEANTGAYGDPVPATVPLTIEKGPFIVVTGHDLRDLKMLLEQTDGRGVNIYTHSEMLPGHGYPELKKHPQLKGNFGTAWQNQQHEFEDIPAPVLFTTNCLMRVKSNYSDRIYTTSVVDYPGMKHIEADADGRKDFSALIDQAIELGGYAEDKHLTGVNGGNSVTTGFGRQTVLNNAPAIIDAVKAGAIKHFFLVGGCDGAKPGRNYYTELVKQTPADTVVLTLACGKYRINDLDIGAIGPFPRILDMGQCNDAYGAIQVAVALAGAFNCGVNDLPLTLVLSWYEQKAVCILLTLLSLGIKNIYIGPSIPAFFSDDVLKVLVDKFNLHPISTPEQDLKSILKA